jgi:hypothetical protein
MPHPALSARAAGVPVAIPAAVRVGSWGRLARPRRLRLGDPDLTGVLLPQVQDKVDAYSQPAFFGEIALMLWLVIKGARPPALHATALSSAVG